jgi:hypothetical protein
VGSVDQALSEVEPDSADRRHRPRRLSCASPSCCAG